MSICDISTQIYKHTNICIYTNVCMHTCTDIYMQTWFSVHACRYSYTYWHEQTYTRACTNTYTHSRIDPSLHSVIHADIQGFTDIQCRSFIQPSIQIFKNLIHLFMHSFVQSSDIFKVVHGISALGLLSYVATCTHVIHFLCFCKQSLVPLLDMNHVDWGVSVAKHTHIIQQVSFISTSLLTCTI